MLLPLLLGQGTGGPAEVIVTLSVTDTADTLASSAALSIIANLSRTDTDDTLASAAAVTVQADASTTDADDTLSCALLVDVTVNLAATDSPDALDSAVTVDQPSGGVVCDLDVTDEDDLIAASCTVDQAAEQEQGHNGRDWRKFDVPTRRVLVALSVLDDGDTLQSLAAVGQVLRAGLSVLDDDDLLQAVAALAWPQAQLVINSARLKRLPTVPLIKTHGATKLARLEIL